jgi:NAD-dependent deacetylase
MMNMDDKMDRLKEIVANSKQLAAFTGAGLSAESGIPTYRGTNGIWAKYDPAKYANFQYFIKDPSYYWQFFRDVRYPSLKQAQPNAAHYVLVELEKQGILNLVITQNIDGLHQMAGQSKVCELHGNSRQMMCMECNNVFPMEKVYEQLEKELPPHCSCGGLLRPKVVLFGESLPQEALMQAWQAAEECDTFLVVGSSLVVYPAAQIPVRAKEHGASLVIVNIDETPLDTMADLVIHQTASEVLGQLTI